MLARRSMMVKIIESRHVFTHHMILIDFLLTILYSRNQDRILRSHNKRHLQPHRPNSSEAVR